MVNGPGVGDKGSVSGAFITVLQKYSYLGLSMTAVSILLKQWRVGRRREPMPTMHCGHSLFADWYRVLSVLRPYESYWFTSPRMNASYMGCSRQIWITWKCNWSIHHSSVVARLMSLIQVVFSRPGVTAFFENIMRGYSLTTVVKW